MASLKRSPEIERALLDPTDVFSVPEEVVERDDISRSDKIEILKRWEYDARTLEVAEEENMASDRPDLLGRVMKALLALGVEEDPDRQPPTKQG